MPSITARERRAISDKASYQDWVRFKYLVEAVQLKGGPSDRDLSRIITDKEGWLTAARNYPYMLGERHLRAMEQIAKDYDVPLYPPLTANGRIPEGRESILRIMSSEVEDPLAEVPQEKQAWPKYLPQTLGESEAARVTQAEQIYYLNIIEALKKRGKTVREIAEGYTDYSHYTSIYNTLKPGSRTTYKHYRKMVRTFQPRFGDAVLQDVIAGGTGIFNGSRPAKPETAEVPAAKPIAPPRVAGEDPFRDARVGLSKIISEIEEASKGLPLAARVGLDSEVLVHIKKAVEGLAQEEA